MGKRRTRQGQSGRSARNGRKYILGGIAAVVVIIAAAAVLWQFFGKSDSGKDKEASQNGAGQTVQSGEKTDQAVAVVIDFAYFTFFDWFHVIHLVNFMI